MITTGTETLGIIALIQTVVTVGAVIIKDVVKNKNTQAAIDRIAQTIKTDTPAAVEIGEKALHGVKTVVEDVLKSPGVAARLAPLEAKLHADAGKLKETTIYHLASEALLAYRRVYSELTPDEIATVVQQVQAGVAKLGLGTVAENEIQVALQKVEKGADTFIQSPLFQQTAALVATKAKLQAQALPVTVPAASPSTEPPAQPAQADTQSNATA